MLEPVRGERCRFAVKHVNKIYSESIVRSRNTLIYRVLPNLEGLHQLNHQIQREFFQTRMIIAPHNNTIDELNDLCLSKTQSQQYNFVAVDTATFIRDAVNQEVPEHWIRGCKSSGMTPRLLKLKIGLPIILLRNLDLRSRLSSGTRLRVMEVRRFLIKCEILTGDASFVGSVVSLPRIELEFKEEQLGFTHRRRQFPVKLAFAITINKAQGQSMERVGLDLATPIFTHGQLYVTLSRVTDFRNVWVLVEGVIMFFNSYCGLQGMGWNELDGWLFSFSMLLQRIRNGVCVSERVQTIIFIPLFSSCIYLYVATFCSLGSPFTAARQHLYKPSRGAPGE